MVEKGGDGNGATWRRRRGSTCLHMENRRWVDDPGEIMVKTRARRYW